MSARSQAGCEVAGAGAPRYTRRCRMEHAPPRPAVEVSATEPDLRRERFPAGSYEPGKRLLAAIRLYQRHPGRGPKARLARAVAVVSHRVWSAVCGSDIPLGARIGGGLRIPHPHAIVIHPDASIGPNCVIFQGVTVGEGGPRPGLPRIGGHVELGAGAKVLGGVAIGDHARIGANAVVLEDVPPFGVAVGVPARILDRFPAQRPLH